MIKRRILEGVVLSDKMQKSCVVLVSRRVPHSLYKKTKVKRNKFKVHDEENRAKVGDRVRIIESRPFSKEKRFKLFEILK